MALQKIMVKVKGIAPLCVHNSQLADPMNKWTKEIKKISGKRKKVDADFEEMAKLEFFGGLYVNDQKQPIIPGECIDATIIGAARRSKDGKKAQLAVRSSDLVIEYDGPKNFEELFIEKFRYAKLVKIGQSRIMRTRPIFREWGGSITIEYDNSEIDESTIKEWVKDAGLKIGLCERRPMFGRFEVVS